jgi:hypothetical protein
MTEIPAGAMRFNSDSQKLEYWNGSAWFQVHTATPNLATSGDSTPGARAVFAGGENTTDVIEYINLASTGDAITFGNLVGTDRRFATGCSSSTRGLFGTGGTPFNNDIDLVTISSTGSAEDFGNATTVARTAACSNQTRGIWAGGMVPASPATDTNHIQYVTIASKGDTVEFGDLTIARYELGGFASPTRGIFVGGGFVATPGTYSNTIDFITIASTANAQDFGDLSILWRGPCGFSNGVRGVYGSGYVSPGRVNTIEYVIMSTTGSGTNFGDLTEAKSEVYATTCSPTRGIWAGGQTPTLSDVIEYVTINTEGNAVDFGNLTAAKSGVGACSNAHGGL